MFVLTREMSVVMRQISQAFLTYFASHHTLVASDIEDSLAFEKATWYQGKSLITGQRTFVIVPVWFVVSAQPVSGVVVTRPW